MRTSLPQRAEPPYFTTEAGKPRCAKRIVSPKTTVMSISAIEVAAGRPFPNAELLGLVDGFIDTIP